MARMTGQQAMQRASAPVTSPPLVSVVMPSLNQASFIEEAISSVLAQEAVELELVVVDGGSHDGTQDLLGRIASNSGGKIRWISEPDSGPASAVNKGFAMCRGEVVGWLNADDRYTPGSIGRALEALQSNAAWGMVYGHGRHVDENGDDVEPYPSKRPDVGLAAFAEGCFICQPTVFLRRSMVTALGPLDDSLRAAFDLEWWLRAFSRMPGSIGFVDAVQAESRLHTASITSRQREAVFREAMMLLARHLGAAPLRWFRSYQTELQLADGHSIVGVAPDAPNGRITAANEDHAGHAARKHLHTELTAFAASVEQYLVPADRKKMQRLLVKQSVGYRLGLNRFRLNPLPAILKSLRLGQTPTLAAQAEKIRAAGVFDEAWYLRRYPDVAAARLDPILHYLRHGAREGRNPSTCFDTLAYRQAAGDENLGGQNPLLHFLERGQANPKGGLATLTKEPRTT